MTGRLNISLSDRHSTLSSEHTLRYVRNGDTTFHHQIDVVIVLFVGVQDEVSTRLGDSSLRPLSSEYSC